MKTFNAIVALIFTIASSVSFVIGEYPAATVLAIWAFH